MFDLTARPSHPAVAHALEANGPGPSADVLTAALDEVGQGLLILDAPTGRLRHANRLALGECVRHDLLSLEGGALRAIDPADQRLLQQALQASVQGRRGLVSLRGGPPTTVADAEGARSVDSDTAIARASDPNRNLDADLELRRSGRPPSGSGRATRGVRPVVLVVAVVPLPPHFGLPQALVVLGHRQLADALGVGHFARLHGLTPTEESVLLGLCRGRQPADIAADQGVAISTIRTHVNALRVKTGASSIRALALQVAHLPALAPALRDHTAAAAGSRLP